MQKRQKMKNFKRLKTGDIVKNFVSDRTYVVVHNYGDRVTAVTTADLTNPSEWVKVRNK